MTGFSYIILHRGLTAARLKNLVTVVNYIKKNIPEAEIIIVEEDGKPTDLSFLQGIKHIFLYNEGLFNRSWGFNVGFQNASHDIVAFGDNDLIVPREALIEAIDKCPEYLTISPYPYNKVFTLDRQATNKLIETGEIAPSSLKTVREGACYAGGLLFMTQEAFKIVGGWDERIRGWGTEDDVMTIRIKKLIGHTHELPYFAVHLYHRIVKEHRHPKNHEIYHQINNMSLQELKDFCAKQFETIGNPKLYEKLINNLCLLFGAFYPLLDNFHLI